MKRIDGNASFPVEGFDAVVVAAAADAAAAAAAEAASVVASSVASREAGGMADVMPATGAEADSGRPLVPAVCALVGAEGEGGAASRSVVGELAGAARDDGDEGAGGAVLSPAAASTTATRGDRGGEAPGEWLLARVRRAGVCEATEEEEEGV